MRTLKDTCPEAMRSGRATCPTPIQGKPEDTCPQGRPGRNFDGDTCPQEDSLADDVLAFASRLTVTSGRKAGVPMIVLPHIEAAIRGSLAPGKRTCCISWPRKQSKSTGYAAVLILAGLVGPLAVPRGQLATASASREQASLIYDEVAAFILAEPELYGLVNLSSSRKTITSLTNGSTFKALSADATTAHGLGLDLFIMDEAAQQRNSELWDVLFTSYMAPPRSQE